MKQFKADLHIHSCLSPCAELDMTPGKIIRRASELGLNIIAISDHNAADHVETAREIGREHAIDVIPAMEITSSEEVHLLALFEEADECRKVQETVSASMSRIAAYRHDEISQPVVNAGEEVLYFHPLPLINAANIPLAGLVALIHQNNGLAIACHVDREAFSIISQLGFIPESLPLDAVEVSYRIRSGDEAQTFVADRRFPVVSFSDAHHLRDIGRRSTVFHIKAPTLAELSLALRGINGRASLIAF